MTGEAPVGAKEPQGQEEYPYLVGVCVAGSGQNNDLCRRFPSGKDLLQESWER
jgi:hypothetical protein